MTIETLLVDRLAARIVSASDGIRSIAPITGTEPGFELADAYAVLAAITRRRFARGEHPIGYKIGFTNETIWDEYGVHAPIFGPMFTTTAAAADGRPAPLAVGALVEPRIEPEIALRLGRVPLPDMDEAALFDCVDAVAHGFEIVQSLYPGWRFKAADTVAAFALHGRYRHGSFIAIAEDERPDWRRRLGDFSITLFRDGTEIDRGIARNVLGGGPLVALRHLVRGLAEFPALDPLRAGDIVTTGTVTRAFPVTAGERWTTRLDGLPLPAMDVLIG